MKNFRGEAGYTIPVPRGGVNVKSPSQIHPLPFSCETVPKVEADLAGRGVGGVGLLDLDLVKPPPPNTTFPQKIAGLSKGLLRDNDGE